MSYCCSLTKETVLTVHSSGKLIQLFVIAGRLVGNLIEVTGGAVVFIKLSTVHVYH